MAEQSEASLCVPCLPQPCLLHFAGPESEVSDWKNSLPLSVSWLSWHSGCGTDGRQLHLSGFLYLLFGNQWLHYRRPVQLHSLAVSWAVCSVCLSACQSFSWAVSNWILAGGLITYSAAFAISFPSLYFSFYLDVGLKSDFFSQVHVFTHLDLRPSVCSTLHHLCPHRQFCCCLHVSVNSQYPLAPISGQ